MRVVLAEFDPGDDLLGLLGRLDVLGWILLGAAVALILLPWHGVVGRTRLGTIDVEPIQTDSETKLSVVAATAELQRELARSGLRPPGGVPGGSPTTKLVSAVESAPINQAKWLAGLIALLPIPARSMSYTVSSTLRKDGTGSHVCGLTYKVVNSATSRCVLLDTAWHQDPRPAIHAAANAIYRAISKDAVDAVPTWARWSDSRALVRYRKGLDCEERADQRVERRYASAARHFLAASELDPQNMLVRLRYGNCLERLAGCQGANDIDRIKRWIDALHVYAAVRNRHPAIFQSRYRMSVVLGLIADSLDVGDEQTDTDLNVLLYWLAPTSETGPDSNVARLQERLRTAARLESKAALKQLRGWSTLLHESRLRHEFEPRGRERRRLRKALLMSSWCLRVRRHAREDGRIPWGLEAVPRVCWRWWVYWRYFKFRWPLSGWQAHYNAAAFYALLPESGDFDKPNLPGHRIRARAFKHLVYAIEDPKHELGCAYVRDEDLDLQVLREVGLRARDPVMLQVDNSVSPRMRARLDREKLRWRNDVVQRLCGPQAVLHYRPSDGAPAGWTVEIRGTALPKGRSPSPVPVKVTPDDEFSAVFRVPIYDASKPLSFRLVNGDRCDGDEREFVPAAFPATEVWLLGDREEIFVARSKALEALRPASPQ